jgi:hypothetical protein
MANIDIKFSIVALTESWLKPHNMDLYDITDYQHEGITRSEKIGGGISIYIHDSLSYKVRDDLTINTNNIQSLWLEINKSSIGSLKNTLIGVFYRRPGSDPYEFNTALTDILTKIKSENKPTYHLGDYNLDLLKTQTHLPTSQFVDINFANAFFPLITKPTRITSESATLIDNIFTNVIDHSSSVHGIILTDISDHLPIFHIIQHSSSPETVTPLRDEI